MSLNCDNINNVRNKEIFYKNIIELGKKLVLNYLFIFLI